MCRAGNQLYAGELLSRSMILAATLAETVEKVPDLWNWTANVADRAKKNIDFLSSKKTDILSSKDAPTCILTYNVRGKNVKRYINT